MTQAQLLTDLTNDLVAAAFISSLLFIAVYSALAPWWRSDIGRALVMLDGGLALILGPSVLHRLLGVALITSTWFSYYYLGSLGLVVLATLWRTWIVAKTQWQGREKPQPPPPQPEEQACDHAAS